MASDKVKHIKQILKAEQDNCFRTAQIDLDALHFPPQNYGRRSSKNVARLVQVFESQGCLHWNLEHHIKVKISMAQFENAFEASGCDAADLLSVVDRSTLKFSSGSVECLSRLYRIEATK
jgi:hypothetical protein